MIDWNRLIRSLITYPRKILFPNISHLHRSQDQSSFYIYIYIRLEIFPLFLSRILFHPLFFSSYFKLAKIPYAYQSRWFIENARQAYYTRIRNSPRKFVTNNRHSAISINRGIQKPDLSSLSNFSPRQLVQLLYSFPYSKLILSHLWRFTSSEWWRSRIRLILLRIFNGA